MSHLAPIDPATSTGKTKELLDTVKSAFGMVPNMTRVMANSPVVLESFLAFNGTLASGSLPPQLREQIGLVVAQQNSCNYCLSAHAALGKMLHLTPEQIAASRKGDGSSEKATAALTFAKRLVENKAQTTSADFDALRSAGYTDAEIAEIIGYVALNLFTNYFNLATAVDVDFPKVSYAEAA
jgi:uncharacterized peroxidase-related enzyme